MKHPSELVRRSATDWSAAAQWLLLDNCLRNPVNLFLIFEGIVLYSNSETVSQFSHPLNMDVFNCIFDYLLVLIA